MSEASPAQGRYLDLLADVLIRLNERTEWRTPRSDELRSNLRLRVARRLAHACGFDVVHRLAVDVEARRAGRDWPASAETMVGRARLDNVRYCVETALAERIPGDLVETGVWRGGTVIFMKAILDAYEDTTRSVWVADSFQGLPPPDEAYPADAGDPHHEFDHLAISRREVEDNFRKYGVLDDRVRFLEGWFRDTLPTAPIEQIAVLRLDGDLYQSTWEALTALYPKVSAGGFVIVDDYGALPTCKAAVEDYRAANNITAPIHEVDWTGVWWRV